MNSLDWVIIAIYMAALLGMALSMTGTKTMSRIIIWRADGSAGGSRAYPQWRPS